MQVTETTTEGLKRAYTVVLPADEVERRRGARLAELAKTVRLAGFRPGKVPMPVVRQRFGAAVTAEVIEAAVDESTRQILSERGLRPALQPRIDLESADQAGDLKFNLALEILPEIALPDFAALALTRLKAEPKPETLEELLAGLAARNRETAEIPAEELAGRGAEKGEIVRLDFVGRIDGEEFDGGKSTGAEVEVAGPGFIEGFAEQIEGIRPGETRTISVRFPDPYQAPALAGKAAEFEITAHTILRVVKQQADDELAKKLSFESLDELKDMLRGQIERQYQQTSRARLKRDLLDRLSEQAAFPVPEGLTDAEFGQIWARLEEARKAGQLDEDDKNKTEEVLRAEYRAIAERRVRLGLLLAEVARVHGLTVSAEEMNRAMRAEASRYPGQEGAVLEFFRKNPQMAESLRGPLIEDKVVDFVIELAQVTDQLVTPEELTAEPPASAPASVEPASASADTGSEAATGAGETG